MNFIDLHCDTLQLYAYDRVSAGDLFQNECAVDFLRMKEAGMSAQFFAMFMPVSGHCDYLKHPEIYRDGKLWDEGFLTVLYRGFKQSIEEHSDLVSHVSTWVDYENARREGKLSAFLTVEDGRAVDGKMENLQELRRAGVSLISLTWNFENCFGSPNSRNPKVMAEGLTEFGKEAITEMNDLGIIVDVSHLSDGGFYDVAALCKKPFVASHSNARALSPHPRNLTDEMIRILADKGGVMGLNFCPAFLLSTGEGEDSRIEDMVRHLEHIRQVGGSEVIALGGDLDGIGGRLEIDSCDKVVQLFDALKQRGFTEEELDKLAFKNVERVLRECL